MSDCGVAAATDTALCDLGKQSLHQIQPASAGGREVHMIAGMAREPVPYSLNFVRSVVIHHQMHVDAGRNGGIDACQEFQELLMAVAAMGVADRLTSGHVQRREQRGYAVIRVLVPRKHGARDVFGLVDLRPVTRGEKNDC